MIRRYNSPIKYSSFDKAVFSYLDESSCKLRRDASCSDIPQHEVVCLEDGVIYISRQCNGMPLFMETYTRPSKLMSRHTCKCEVSFLYRLDGTFDERLMEMFNGLRAVKDKIALLRENGVSLVYYCAASDEANSILIRAGGLEMPKIVGEMVRHFYYDRQGRTVSLAGSIDHLVATNVAEYEISDLRNIYTHKVSCLAEDLFSANVCNYRGGYVIEENGHTLFSLNNEVTWGFQDFLLSKLRFESPSHSRHKDMVIEKIGGKYYLKLALQLRFKMQR